MNEHSKYDLAIVGGGIAGPALAAALADSGLNIVLIERSTKPLDTTRGDQLQPATCEHMEHWGVLDMLFERGAEKRLGSRWMTATGETLCETPVDKLDIPHPYFLYLNHELISEVLLERAQQNQRFTLIRPARASVVKDADGPGQHALDVEQDGNTTTVAARCIAIADGRMSAARRALDIDAEVYQYENPLLVLFAERKDKDPRNDVWVFITGAGIVSVIPRTGGDWKIGFPVEKEQIASWNGASDTEVRERLAAIAPALKGLKPSVAGVYPVAMVNAATWSNGNCVLLGDACHALHPGRSQGMNIAFANVAALAERMQQDAWTNSHVALRDLEMDNLDPIQSTRSIAAMQQLAASPEKLHQYCMKAAGY
jgi:2-polyprenyl-6-methoxyphenol hydroxylase-like FAD-dependent oxidoreductase